MARGVTQFLRNQTKTHKFVNKQTCQICGNNSYPSDFAVFRDKQNNQRYGCRKCRRELKK